MAKNDPPGGGTGDTTNAGQDEPALEAKLREALRQVVDPEMGLDVVTLGLIREIRVDDGVEIGMVFTTPFCPYGPVLLQQVKDMSRTVTETDVEVKLLDEQWSPDMMEGGDWSDWGLF